MMSLKHWEEKGQWLSLNGHQLFVLDENPTAKETILFLHGFPTASWDWCKIWPTLSKHYRCIAMDFLGFGLSDKPSKHQYSIIEQANLIEALVTEKNLQQFHVLSHDYGDTVAQELLARQNEGVGKGAWQSLCLLNGGLFPETHRPLLIQKLLLSPVGPLLSKLMFKKRFQQSLSSTFGANTPPTADEIDTFWQLVSHNQGQRNFHLLIRYMDERIQHRSRWVSALQQTAIPLALINGSADPISGKHMAYRFRELVTQETHIVHLEHIGHYPQTEAPEQVIEHYTEFLKALH